jgi:hypothetical protein
MSEERWGFVDEKGRLMLHTENDGETFLNRGPEAVETEITLDELRASYPSLIKKAEEALRGAGISTLDNARS